MTRSNSNGTYFNLAVEHVNRDSTAYVDFEKMIGLDGIAVINVVVSSPMTDTTELMNSLIPPKRRSLVTRSFKLGSHITMEAVGNP
jgi:hypothetical protein